MQEYLYSQKPFIIAETAYTFEGSKKYLLQQTLKLSDKVNAIKYHILINTDEYMVYTHPLYKQVQNWLLSKKDWGEILIEAKNKNLDIIVLVDDTEAIKFCNDNSKLIDAIEVHAACVNDLEILNRAIEFANKYDKVFILGISGFEIQELQDIAEYLKKKKLRNILLMYGFQNYPTKINEINLSKMSVLEDILNCKVGYADHTDYSDVNKEVLIYTAFALGANIQEIHYVLEEGVERIDYSTGIGLSRLENIKETLENIYYAIGNSDFRLNEGEKQYLNFRKVPVYSSDFNKGKIFERESVVFKRVETPLRQHRFRGIESNYGKIIKHDVMKDTEICSSDFKD
ncbi:MAG: N-acetylneuraminate synthase family protein [Dysgonamonadaceae bacterium]|nr:N-acetylneuraminate synthase family protein [Dysgonamonadaceae bacterium]